jgi:hypothetical protein
MAPRRRRVQDGRWRRPIRPLGFVAQDEKNGSWLVHANGFSAPQKDARLGFDGR